MSILCERIISVLPDAAGDDPAVDWVDIAWHELDKSALGRRSRRGRMVRIILPHDQHLEHGAVLVSAGSDQVVVNVLPCQAMIIDARSATEFAQAAYAIGNQHIPAQIEAGRIILPADGATEAALGRLGISYRLEVRRIRPIPNVLPRLNVAGELAESAELAGETIKNPCPIPVER